MEITTEIIKSLRDKTGLSVMQCKKALEEAGGDIAQAEVLLRKYSGAAADKKADRALGAGSIGSYIHDGTIGAMVLLSSETDFVSKNQEFIDLARSIAMHVAATNPQYVTEEEIPVEAKTAAEAVFLKEVDGLSGQGKPEAMKASILEGKMKSYFKDQVLLSQPYIKDESKTIRDLIAEATQKFGERVEVSRFARLSLRG